MACFLNCVRFDVSKTITDKPTSKESGLICYSSWDDVEALTSNFSRLIGSGGYSSIYMARFSGSVKAALKVHVSSHRLYQVFRLELDILLRLHHPNIVKLLGYFDDSGITSQIIDSVKFGAFDQIHRLILQKLNLFIKFTSD